MKGEKVKVFVAAPLKIVYFSLKCQEFWMDRAKLAMISVLELELT